MTPAPRTASAAFHFEKAVAFLADEGLDFVPLVSDGAGEVVGPVTPDSTGCVRMIRHHLAPGRYAVRWD